MLKRHWCRTLWNIIRPAPACSIHILSSLYWRYLPTSKIVGQILILPRRPRKTTYRSYKYSPSCICFPSGLLFCKLALKVNNSQLRQTFSGDLSAKKYPTQQHSGESKNLHQPIMQICRERDYASCDSRLFILISKMIPQGFETPINITINYRGIKR